MSQIKRAFDFLEQPVDGASVAFLRISFAVVMVYWLALHIVLDKIAYNYYEPSFLFPYSGFEWIRSWPGRGLHVHFLITLMSAAGMLFGVFYRLNSIIFAVGFTYIFLLDKATYQNHYYFICLMSLLFTLIPAHRVLSFDAIRLGTPQTVPRWSLWMLRFQIGLVYFFGGVAKINQDWLAGFPMRQVLEAKQDHFLIGTICTEEWFVLAFVWSGMLFDLLIVALLLYSRTRILGFGLCLVFHLLNASLFRIGVFPWLMILATTIFFLPDWPRKLLTSFFGQQKAISSYKLAGASRLRPLLYSFLALFVGLQVILPLRHLAVNENTSWTERNHHFSWHMKLRGKVSAVRFYTRNEATNQWALFSVKEHLKLHQLMRMSRDPFMIRDFALFIEDYYRKLGIAEVEVRVFILSSLNGRKPQLLINPSVDLTKAKLPSDWIMPLEAKTGGDFNEPLERWESIVMQDPILAEIRHQDTVKHVDNDAT